MRHYHRVYSSPVYLAVLTNTLKISIIVTFLCLLLGYPLAALLASVKERTRNLLIIAVILPYFTSILVRSYSWLVLLGREGLINQALRTLGLADQPFKLVYNTIGVLIGMTHILLPIMVLSLYSVLHGIKGELLKVSASLGASRVHTFFRIYFPLSLPGVGAGCILVFIFAVGYYVTPALLGGLQDTMLSTLIATQIEELLNWGFGAALSVLLLALTLCLFLAFNRALGLDRIWGGAGVRKPYSTAVGLGLPLKPLQKLARRLGRAALEGLESRVLWVVGIPSRLRRAGHAAPASRSLAPSRRANSPDLPRASLYLICALILTFLLAPILLVFPVSFTSSLYLRFPPSGFSLQWYREVLEAPYWVKSLSLSLRVASVSMILAIIMGTLAAIALARGQFPYKNACYMFLLSPLVVPVITIAVALYYFFSQLALVGTFWGLVLGHTIGGIPLVTVVVASALKGFDVTLEHAAMSLGAGRVRTFRQITFPVMRPAIIVAGFFAFIHSFDEVVIASFIGGIGAETLPKKMWEGVRLEIKPTLAAISSLLIGFTAAMLLAIAFLQRRQKGGAG